MVIGRKHLEYFKEATNTKVAYFAGIGLGGQRGEYLLNGAMALDIMDQCVVRQCVSTSGRGG
jgi:hypothetical protein